MTGSLDFSSLFPRIRQDLEAEIEARRLAGDEPDLAVLYAEWCDKNYPILLEQAAKRGSGADGKGTGIDRRRHPRVPIRLNVFYRILWIPGEKGHRAKDLDAISHASKGENVSAGGLFILSEDKYPIGTLVEIEFDLPGLPEPIPAFGMVTWAHQDTGDERWGHGIAFSHIDMPVAQALEETILQRLLDAPISKAN